jgi:tRNA nucleotidyltransferase (CCA-adding enzyme)
MRLGFALDRGTARAQALALRLAPYPALSPQRIAAEIEHLLDEPAPGAALARLGAAGAFRLLDRRFRYSRATAARVAALPPAIAWMRRRELSTTALELAALALAADQPSAAGAAVLRQLGFSGEPLAKLLHTSETVPALAGRLRAMATAPLSARAAVLRDRAAIDLAWAWLIGDPAARERLDWYLDTASHVRGELRGEDLVALGVPRGPAVGIVLRRLRDARLDGGAQSRDDEIVLVREWQTETALHPTTREEG